jgi:flagellar basal-body rod protein FlgB
VGSFHHEPKSTLLLPTDRPDMQPDTGSVQALVGGGAADNRPQRPPLRACIEDRAMINRLTDTLNFQTQALSLRSERQRLLASNIANADTPGYAARDFDFARALKDATSTQAAGSARARTDAVLRYSAPSQTNLDGNSVDMDRERAAFAENTLKYDATLRFINGSVRTLQDAMKSHNQG